MEIGLILQEALKRLTELPVTSIYQQDGIDLRNTAEPGTIGYWIVAATILFSTVVYLCENYLNLRQLKTHTITELPKQLEIIVA